jgi:hypothetical protein
LLQSSKDHAKRWSVVLAVEFLFPDAAGADVLSIDGDKR